MTNANSVHSNLQGISQVVSEVIWRYVITHTSDECEALKRRVEENRRIRQMMFGAPIPVNPRLAVSR